MASRLLLVRYYLASARQTEGSVQAAVRWAITSLAALSLVAAARVSLEGQAGTGSRGAPPGPRFPAHLRPPDDPAIVERGKQVYAIACRSCHGPDLRGGDMGGPNLLRSPVMLNDLNGELLLPIIRGSRASAGMPAIELGGSDATAVAIYIHSVLATAQRQGAPPPGAVAALNVLVGDAAAGAVYFKEKCASCHSATGDLQGIGARVADPVQLQNLWVAGGRNDRSNEADDSPRGRDVMATITPETGARVEGRLDRIDDFIVSVVLSDGTRRTFRRVDDDSPKVAINDPLAAHRKLLETYTDRDMHNVTAYLVTLK
jgi:cytochrome c oxidase cbb3-type subunit 3